MPDVYVHSVHATECSCGWSRDDDWKVRLEGERDMNVYPCAEHRSLLRMPEWERVIDIATDCPSCEVTG